MVSAASGWFLSSSSWASEVVTLGLVPRRYALWETQMSINC